MNDVVGWLLLYGHIVGAAVWTGSYTMLAFVIVPLTMKGANEAVGRVAVATVRAGTYAGTLVIGFGVVLIGRTNGYDHLFGSRWGALVLAAIGIAVVLFGVGDGALRPALVRLAAGGDGRGARGWSLAGLALTVTAIGLMSAAASIG